MPPASSPGSHGQPTEHTSQHPSRPDDRARRTPDRAAKVRFRRAVTLMVMTLFLPGSAQLVAGNRTGRPARHAHLVRCCCAVGALTAPAQPGLARLRLLGRPPTRSLLGAVKPGPDAAGRSAGPCSSSTPGGSGSPCPLVKNQRLAVVGINGLLCFTVAGTLLFGAHLVGVHRDFVIHRLR